MDHKVGLDRFADTVGLDSDLVSIAEPLDGLDVGVASKTDTDLTSALDKEIDEIRVEILKRTVAPHGSHDDRGASCTGDKVGELKGDEASTDEKDAYWECFKIQELTAVNKVLRPGEAERSRSRSSRNQETVGAVVGVSDIHLPDAGEVCVPVEHFDPVASQVLFHKPGNRIGKAMLMLHQVRPVDRQSGVIDAFASHEPGAVDDFGSTPQDFLRIATS